MDTVFAQMLRRIRTDQGLSQKDLADRMFVTRSTIARWENGSRFPDIAMIRRLADCMGVDVGLLLNTITDSYESPNVILLDDTKIALSGGLPVLEEVLPGATVIGFTKSSEALAYARDHPVALAFLDIELGKASGLDICQALLDINPRTNIIFVTAYSNYSLDAWKTGASGFMLKPITPEGVKQQLRNLRYPLSMGGASL